jgi:hypothetical protein
MDLLVDAVRQLEEVQGITDDKVLGQAIESMAAVIVSATAAACRPDLPAGGGDDGGGGTGGSVAHRRLLTAVPAATVAIVPQTLEDAAEDLCGILLGHFEQSLRPKPLQAELKELLHKAMHARFTAWGDASKRKDLAERAVRFLINLSVDNCTSEAADLALALWRLSKHTLGSHHEASISILTGLRRVLVDTSLGGLDKPSQEAVLQMLEEGVQGAEDARSGQSLVPYRPADHMELLIDYTHHLLTTDKEEEVSSLGAKVLIVMKEIRDEDMVDRYRWAPVWLFRLLKAPFDKWPRTVHLSLLAVIEQRVDAVRSKWDDCHAQWVAEMLDAAKQLALSAVTPPPNQQQAQEVPAPEPTTATPAGQSAPLVSHNYRQQLHFPAGYRLSSFAC